MDTQRLNDLVYVSYNLRLWVKQLEKKPEVEAISLDHIDTTAAWRAEIEEPIMEAAPDWLEDDTQDMETETWDDEWLDASKIVPPPEPPATSCRATSHTATTFTSTVSVRGSQIYGQW